MAVDSRLPTPDSRLMTPDSRLFLLPCLTLNIPSPFLNNLLHIIRYLRIKPHFLSCLRMYKAKRFCMQCMPWANGKTIIYKLFVFGEDSSFYNAVAAIGIIIE